MNVFRNLRKKWIEFCKETTIHGLFYAFATNNIVRFTKEFWRLIFLAMFILCSYQNWLNVKEYFSFKTLVSITYNTQSNLTFPAITFSTMSMFRKSGLGNVSAAAVLLATWLADEDSQVQRLMKENRITCQSDTKSNFTMLFDEKGLNVIYSIGIPETAKIATLNFESTLTKCWWKDKNMNCSDAFVNHLSDTFASFTFNGGNDLVRESSKNPMPDKPLVKASYGLDIANYDENHYYINSPMQGLRLLMNVNQKDYCGNDMLKRGSGFMFFVHDVNGIPSVTLGKIYYLSPGYNIDISMRKVIYKRIADDGKCSDTSDLYFFPMLNNSNLMNACFLQCTTEVLLKECKCYLPPLLPFDKYIKDYAANFNMSKNDVKFCWELGEIACMRKWRQALINAQRYDLCPKCKELCIEGQYEIQITQLRKSKFNYDKWLNVSDIDELKKNYLLVNFHFADMNLQTIVISESFTLKDLFIYFGTNIGLFLGMSFVSLFELADIFVQFIHMLLVKKDKVIALRKQKKSVKRVRTVTLAQYHRRMQERTVMTKV